MRIEGTSFRSPDGRACNIFVKPPSGGLVSISSGIWSVMLKPQNREHSYR
jgi:hypothetical protein